MLKIRGVCAAAALTCLLAGTASAGGAEEATGSTWDSWHNWSIQYAYSWDAGNDFILGYGSEAEDRHQVRLELENIWKYGENYVYADVLHSSGVLGGDNLRFGFPCCGDGKETEWYGLVNANLSAQKVFGLQRGLFDAAIEGRLEKGSFYNYHAYAAGASLYLNLPWFVQKPGDKIQFTWWRRWNDDEFVSSDFDGGGAATDRYADHNLWGLTVRKEWDMLGVRWSHQTFLRYQQEEEGEANELKRFDRIFWESEIFAYLNNNLSVGFRSEYFYDQGGIDFDGIKSHWRPMAIVKVDLTRSD